MNILNENIEAIEWSLMLKKSNSNINIYNEINAFEFDDPNQAIEFLKEQDPTLEKSLKIANTLGYELYNIDSLILATMLLREKLRNYYEEKYVFKTIEV